MLIHIGYHKTATTWLQQRLFFNAECSAFYPFAADLERPRALAKYFVCDAEGALLSAFSNHRAELAATIEEIRQATRGRTGTPVLSDERLSGNPHSGGFDAARIAGSLHEHFPDAHVLIVIREQRSLTLSCYFQYLSIGGTRSLTTYMRDRYDGRVPGFSFANIDFLPLVRHYRQRWGAERVTVLPYELFAAEPRRFLAYVESKIGRTIDVPASEFEVKVNSNRRPGAAHALRWLNRFRRCSSVNDYSPLATPSARRVAEAAFQLLSRLFSDAGSRRLMTRLTAQVDARIGDRYRQSNAELSEICGMDLSQYGYR